MISEGLYSLHAQFMSYLVVKFGMEINPENREIVLCSKEKAHQSTSLKAIFKTEIILVVFAQYVMILVTIDPNAHFASPQANDDVYASAGHKSTFAEITPPKKKTLVVFCSIRPIITSIWSKYSFYFSVGGRRCLRIGRRECTAVAHRSSRNDARFDVHRVL